MKNLILIPDTSAVQVAAVNKNTVSERAIFHYRELDEVDMGSGGGDTVIKLREFGDRALGGLIDSIAFRVPTGGAEFSGPVIANMESRLKLAGLAPVAPIHIPAILWLLGACDKAFPEVSSFLVFETAFFTALPRRESLYALNPDEQSVRRIQRYGYHGLFHEAAARLVHKERRRSNTGSNPLRIISVCLERRPEVAGIRGCRPVTTSGGTTPLEGIPGEKTCGQIDPSLPTLLADRLGWGPEQVNGMLTRESGLYGLVGREITMGEVIGTVNSDNPAEMKLARNVISHVLLQYVGMAAAALGGVDALVISGRYHMAGESLIDKLRNNLVRPGKYGEKNLSIHVLEQPLELIVADYANLLLEKAK